MVNIVIVLAACAVFPVASSLSASPQLRDSSLTGLNRYRATRRDFFSLLPLITATAAEAADSRSTVTLRLNSPDQKAGLKLGEVTIGNPPRTAVAVERVLPGGLAERAGVQAGVVLLDFSNAKSVADRIRIGPYPIDLKFYNLAAGGDAFGDLGKPLVTAQDALELAKSTTATTTEESEEKFVIRVLKQPPASCGIQSRRGDVLEINYEARIKSSNGPIYDSSAQRGTGLPYQFVLGSGDMIPGVDKGMYEMCPGEARLLEIPPVLGYGPRASKLFGIPSGSRLFWTVEVVTVNSVQKGDERTRDELEGRAW
jgi:FK506-binding protein 2